MFCLLLFQWVMRFILSFLFFVKNIVDIFVQLFGKKNGIQFKYRWNVSHNMKKMSPIYCLPQNINLRLLNSCLTPLFQTAVFLNSSKILKYYSFLWPLYFFRPLLENLGLEYLNFLTWRLWTSAQPIWNSPVGLGCHCSSGV